MAATARRAAAAVWGCTAGLCAFEAAGTIGAADQGFTVEIERFHGRIGNNLAQLGHVLVMAEKCGASSIDFRPAKTRLEPTIVEARSREDMLAMFNLPDVLPLPGNASSGIPEACTANAEPYLLRSDGLLSGVWYSTPCEGVFARDYHDVLQRHLRPLFGEALRRCLEAPSSPEDEHTLVVHLRGDDMYPNDEAGLDTRANRRPWLFPPCSMYERIIEDGQFRRLVVVTSRDRKSPCLSWLEDLQARRPDVEVEFQIGTLVEDTCMILRARHIVVSYSSFVHNLAVLSDQVRTIYTRGVFDPHWLLDCNVRPGIRVVRYDVDVSYEAHEPYNETYRGAIGWIKSHPVTEVMGPAECREEQCVPNAQHAPILCALPAARRPDEL